MNNEVSKYHAKSQAMNLWVEERHGEDFATRFRCHKVLFSGHSPYQHIDIVETKEHGRILLNDGIVMISDRDEAVYHEMLVHVPLFTHPSPRRVLIIGGGDGGTAREVLRHKNISNCANVEIDELVVTACQKYFPKLACSFKDPRVSLKIQDGVQYVKNTRETYDIVLVDSTDPFGPAKPLFNQEFYTHVSRILAPDGILVAQAESPMFATERHIQKTIVTSLKSVFPLVKLYNYSVVMYPGGLWSFAFASKKYHPVKDIKIEKINQANWDLYYYNSAIHRAGFTQPEFMNKMLR